MLKSSGFVESLLGFNLTFSLKPKEGQWPAFGACSSFLICILNLDLFPPLERQCRALKLTTLEEYLASMELA